MGAKLHRITIAANRKQPELAFLCPGCGYNHWFNSKVWKWNGSLERPTVSPSILVRGTILCHSYVEDGKIRFLKDCEHALAGQTVELPDWEEKDVK